MGDSKTVTILGYMPLPVIFLVSFVGGYYRLGLAASAVAFAMAGGLTGLLSETIRSRIEQRQMSRTEVVVCLVMVLGATLGAIALAITG